MSPSAIPRCNLLSFGIALVLIVLCGCAMDPPTKMFGTEDIDESEIATIHRYSGYEKGMGVWMLGIIPLPQELNHGTVVREVDGQVFERWPGPAEVQVRAGQHSVKVDYMRERSLQACGYLGCLGYFDKEGLAITFFAEGRHEYRVCAYVPDEHEWIWVEDANTGSLVAGHKPPDLEEIFDASPARSQ